MPFCSLLRLLVLSPSSLCCSVSLLRFTFYFFASPLCFSSCSEILLLTQFPLPPHIPQLFASLQLCLPYAYGMLLGGMHLASLLATAAVFTSQVVLKLLTLRIAISVVLTA